MRQPIPLRCDNCDEIIYDDQPYDLYGGDYDTSPMPWHTECWDAYQEKERERNRKLNEEAEILRTKPRDSLTYNELMFLVAYESHQRFIDFITKDL
jgi:hypothetical protein